MVSRYQRGFGMVFALFLVALVGVSLTAAVILGSTQARIEKESQLLFLGDQYRRAIREYYYMSPGSPHYPPNIQDLLKDPRYPNVVRHLRDVYPDPMTGKPFELIRDPASQGIQGVFSGASGEPLKVDGFAIDDGKFKGATRYADWRFEFVPSVGLLGNGQGLWGR